MDLKPVREWIENHPDDFDRFLIFLRDQMAEVWAGERKHVSMQAAYNLVGVPRHRQRQFRTFMQAEYPEIAKCMLILPPRRGAPKPRTVPPEHPLRSWEVALGLHEEKRIEFRLANELEVAIARGDESYVADCQKVVDGLLETAEKLAELLRDRHRRRDVSVRESWGKS